MTKVLLKFNHGLGDAIQFTVVLQHIKKYRPDWIVDFYALRGKHSAANGYCHEIFHDGDGVPHSRGYDVTYKLDWYETRRGYANTPSTKATLCLETVLKIAPDPELYYYKVNVSEAATARAREYLEAIDARLLSTGRYNVVAIHYQGNTSKDKKDLTHDDALVLCTTAITMGFIPVILDWDGRSPLPNNERIHCPPVGPGDIWGEFGSGDAEVLVALLQLCSVGVGIDSGPQKAMMAAEIPTIAVWTRHHPVQFADLSDTTLHLLPEDLLGSSLCKDPAAASYFAANYSYKTYHPDYLATMLRRTLVETLGGDESMVKDGELINSAGWWVHEEKQGQDWVVISDIYVEDAYRTALIPKRKGKEIVVDIGAHIGTFARLWHERNPEAFIVCVEAAPPNLRPLEKNVGSFAQVVPYACTYESEAYLLSTFTEAGLSTGGSRIVTHAEYERERDKQYERAGDVGFMTLHEIMAQYGLEHIDVLKLDCEGSEYSILENAPLKLVGFIVGEYHGFDKWEEFRRRIFGDDWDYGHMSRSGDFGNFHLRNRRADF